MTRNRPTLRSLAAEAGVSAATFSLALRNSPEVGEQTRRRLRRLAQRRGYRPDPTISKLMQHLRTRSDARHPANICGLRQVFSTEKPPGANFGTRMHEALVRRSRALGFAFDAIDVDPDLGGEALQRILLNRGVEGVVIMPMRGQRDLGRLLEWTDFSVVSVTSSVTAPRFHSVGPDHFGNMLRACDELARRGFSRIGLAISRGWDDRVRHRWTGGMAWQNTFGKTTPVPVYLDESTGPAISGAGFIAWLRKNRPDAVVLESIDRDLLDAAWCEIAPRRRPKIVALNWPNPLAEGGIDQRVDEIGAVAIERLAAMMSRGEKGVPARANHTLIDGDWIWRG